MMATQILLDNNNLKLSFVVAHFATFISS